MRRIASITAVLLLVSLSLASPDRTRAAGTFSANSACGGVGAPIIIRGDGLSGAKVRIGPWQAKTEHRSADTLVAYVPAGAATGPLVLELDTGDQELLLDRFVVPAVEIQGVNFTQGVPGYPLVWGKQTLMQIFPVAGGPARCRPEIDSAQVWVRTSSGERLGPYAGVLGDRAGAGPFSVMMESYSSATLGINARIGSLGAGPDAIESFEYALTRNGELVSGGEVGRSDSAFPRFTVVQHPPKGIVVYFYGPGGPSPGGVANLERGLETVMRLWPVPGDSWTDLISPDIQYHMLPARIDVSDVSLNDLTPLLLKYQRTIRPRPDFVLGVLDLLAWDSAKSRAAGIAWPLGNTPVSLALNDEFVGKTMAHELGHTFGLVGTGARNNDLLNNPGHSKYDEGNVTGTYCNDALTFAQSVRDQDPDPQIEFAVNLNTLTEYALAKTGCQGVAKSLMSYAPERSNVNTFFEISDYTALTEALNQSKPTVQPYAGEAIAIMGTISHIDPTAILYSLTETGGDVEASDPDSPYVLVFRDAEANELGRHGFPVMEEELAREKGESAFYQTAAPLPPATRTIEVRYRDRLLSSLTRSANPPAVKLQSPPDLAKARGPVTVSWAATDPDDDVLTFDLLWSGDGGQSFRPLEIGLRSTSADVNPARLPGAAGLLRVVASDGVNTASDQLAVTTSNKAPLVAIAPPTTPERLYEGEPVMLKGTALDPEDGLITAAAQLSWTSDRDGALGTGSSAIARLTPGRHIITLTAVDAAGNRGQDDVALTVLAPDCLSPFKDLDPRHPACAAVSQLASGKVIDGYDDGTFRPEDGVTRAEVAKLLAVTLGLTPEPGAPLPFPDTAGHWAAQQGYLQAATRAGAFEGFPDGTFGPEALVTRAQLIKIAAAAQNLVPAGSADYEDVPDSAWYAIWASSGVHVYPGRFLLPDQPATRAEAAQILANLQGSK